MKRAFKNLLIQYKGGGYDGCHWEWNYFLFDSKGIFHNIAASGYKGIKTKDKALELLNSEPKSSWGGAEFYEYNLKDADSIAEFVSEVNSMHLGPVVKAVNKIYKKDIMYWICNECEDKQTGDMLRDPNAYHGDGRVGIIYTTQYCEDCYCSHSCGYCGEFNELEENNVDEDGHCINCVSKVKEGA